MTSSFSYSDDLIDDMYAGDARYDYCNVFSRIVSNELVCNKVYEDDIVMAFYDAKPKADVHVLLIPKGEYISYNDFLDCAEPGDVYHFFNMAKKIVKDLGIERPGYRMIINTGINGGQEIPHFHMHILGGEKLREPF
jgi:diadenosine tetraphosphate (Ap4A) HIT family hydrolase